MLGPVSSSFDSSFVSRASGTAHYHVLTLYFFSRTDIKTVFVPVTLFALVCAPACHKQPTSRAMECMFWLWLQILPFNLANQTSATGITEDSENKPFRPLPSGRLTLRKAKVLRRMVLFFGLALSATYGPQIFLINVGLVILVIIYHDFHGDTHWLSKNIMNAGGYAFFQSGSTLIAACDRRHFGELAKLSLILSFAIIATTIHVQDFQDREGDGRAGRRTLPIVFPVKSRYTIFFGLTSWSIILCRVWPLNVITQWMVMLLGTVVGCRCVALRTVRDDEFTYFLYNVWLLVAFSLPIYCQLFRQ
ncbi:UbiA prenyltransferase family-domain-containing protein [Mycena vulgaris]|nr:UbiA prenyltransferase family-domain-containing protein [Mycena vulgaris]